MSQVLVHRCKLAECTVGTTDRCIEGLDLSTCPNYIGAEPEAAVPLNSAEGKAVGLEDAIEPEGEIEMIDLPDGLDFSPATAARITSALLTRVIVVAGDEDSGKTTFVTSLYDRFQEGSFAGYIFAGCRTLPGMERRCFPSRIESERVRPDTARTPRSDGQSLLHMRLRVEDLSRPSQDLLLTDISGEYFRAACDSTEECQQLEVLRRADHLALCLDGERLADTGLRHEAFNTGKVLLQSALDADMIGQRTFVDVLITKRDLLGPVDGSTAQTYLNNIRQRLSDEFKHRVGRLRFFEVAARPTVAGFPLAYGLDQVLPSWVEDTPYYLQPQLKDLRAIAADLVKTEFERYLTRQPISNSTRKRK